MIAPPHNPTFSGMTPGYLNDAFAGALAEARAREGASSVPTRRPLSYKDTAEMV